MLSEYNNCYWVIHDHSKRQENRSHPRNDCAGCWNHPWLAIQFHARHRFFWKEFSASRKRGQDSANQYLRRFVYIPLRVKNWERWIMIHPTLTGVLVLLALGFLMPSLAYIPKAILASVIIMSVIFMVELEELKPMWKSRSTSVSNPKI